MGYHLYGIHIFYYLLCLVKEKLIKLKAQHPNALILAHPECEAVILEYADFIGSTTAILNYSKKSEAQEFIVLTETGIIHQMQKASPTKTFIPAPPNNSCACNDCPHMKLNTMEKIYLCMKYEIPEVNVSADLMQPALAPLKRMLEISAAAGL